MHVSSLPGRHGIGDLGEAAYEFADYLAGAGQKLWQVLPVNPTGYGDSPYQGFSAFAGNPLFIDLDAIREQGHLTQADLEGAPAFPSQSVDFGAVIQFKLDALGRAARYFLAYATPSEREAFDAFCQQNSSWLDDYALFMACKGVHEGKVWTKWEPGYPAAQRGSAGRMEGEAGG